MKPPRTALIVLVLAGLGTLAWECGDNDGDNDVGSFTPAPDAYVDVEGWEYGYTFYEPVHTGVQVFVFHNIGDEPHDLFLAKIPEDLDVEAALAAAEMTGEVPDGVEYLHGTEVVGHGISDSAYLYFDPLAPGRYVVFCTVENADGVAHEFLGMWQDFTVTPYQPPEP